MKLNIKLLFITIICVLQSCDSSKQLLAQNNSTENRSYDTKKINSEITINGIFDDIAWNEVEWSTGFTIKGKPIDKKYDTKFKIVFDTSNIYVAIHCLDPVKDSIPLYPSLRDNTSNDWVEIDFDSNLDKATGYAFAVSPYGVRTDMHISGDDNNFDDRWHPKWEVKTSLDNNGWKAEMKIPFNQMIINEDNQSWGLQVTRRLSRREEYSNWQAIPKGTSGWVSQFGKLKGIHSIVGKKVENTEYNANRLINPKELREDVYLLKSVLEDIYPDAYRFTSKEKTNDLFNSILGSLNKPLTEFQFYKLLTPVFNYLGDGHSWIRPSSGYSQQILSTYKMLPLGIKIFDDNIYIMKNFSTSTDVIKGMRINSINGRKSNDIIQELSHFISADGYNKTWKLDVISNNFSYYLTYLLGSQDEFKIEITSPNSKAAREIIIEGLVDGDWKKNSLPKNTNNYRTENWNYHLINDSTGYLSIYTFARGSRFRNYMDDTFKKIEEGKIDNLIIDIRDNGGGNDVNGKYLFSYLAKLPFYYHKGYEVNTRLFEDLVNKIKCCISHEELDFLKTVSSINEEGKRIITDYDKTGYDNPNEITNPKENAFSGNVYLITNGGSFSVTSDFASLVHNTKRGVLVGEETGGGYYGNTSGINKQLILTNSKLRTNINFIKYINSREPGLNEIGRGVLPDFIIKPTQEDISDGIDKELLFVLNMIASRKKN